MRNYIRHRIFNVIDIKELIALEYPDFDGKYKNYEESHDFWELCYVQKGSITLETGDNSLRLCENEIALISPNKKHSYHSENNKNTVFVICFQSFSQSLKAMGDMKFDSDATITGIMTSIIDECSKTFRIDENEHLKALATPSFGGQQAIIILLEYLLICLLRKLSVDKDSRVIFLPDEDFDAVLAQTVINYFKENLCNKLSLNDLCARFNYSRSFLCRTFKNQTGETLISCFNRLKIEEAQRLLRETGHTATGISRHLGFQDVKYFNSLFKKQTGCTPIEYRKNSDERGGLM
ncbi:MAG: helix-turn-helix transcriptional regulator [Clostridia bacterium]|nr:helix-turn-helix transcriptional regulator [Clostridia bacterium]